MSRRLLLVLALLLSLGAALRSPGSALAAPAASAQPQAPEGTRVSPPTATQQAIARDHMHDTYRADFAHKDAASMLALAQRLIANATSSNDDATRYVMLREALELAQRVYDAQTVVDAIDAMARRFRILDVTLKSAALTTICREVHDTEQGMRFLDACMPFLASQVRVDAYEKVEPLLTQSENLARSITSGTDSAHDYAQQLHAWRGCERQYLWAKPAMQKLRRNQDDQGLNSAVGRYQCLVKEEWDQGIEALAKGEDAVVASAAQADLMAMRAYASEAGSPQQTGANGKPLPREGATAVSLLMIRAGDNWFEIAPEQPDTRRAPILRRALYWYRTASSRLSEMQRAHSDQRAEQVQGMLRRRPALLAKLTDDQIDHVLLFRDKFYLLVTQRLDFGAATAWARQHGATLACIADDAESTFLREVMYDNGVNRLWLGALRTPAGKGWTWVDGTPYDYSDWGKDEPDAARPHVQVTVGGRWCTADDMACAFMVQWMAKPPAATAPK